MAEIVPLLAISCLHSSFWLQVEKVVVAVCIAAPAPVDMHIAVVGSDTVEHESVCHAYFIVIGRQENGSSCLYFLIDGTHPTVVIKEGTEVASQCQRVVLHVVCQSSGGIHGCCTAALSCIRHP